MKIMPKLGLIATCLVVCVCTGRGAVEAELYPSVKDITAQKGTSGEVGSFEIDEELFAGTDDTFSNLRVLDGDNNEVPFLVRCRRGREVVTNEVRVGLNTTALDVLPDNRIEILLEKKESFSNALPSFLAFSTKLKNYEKHVTVSAGNDKQEWKVIAEKQPIFDYSKYIDIHNNRIEIEPVSARYYKVEISNITETQMSPFVRMSKEQSGGDVLKEVENTAFKREDFRIEQVDFFEKKQSVVNSSPVIRSYSAVGFKVDEDAEKKQTIISFETSRVPLTSLSLTTKVSNFSRALLVEAGNNGSTWTRIMNGRISKVTTTGYTHKQTSVEFGRVLRYRNYRITIYNDDNPTLEISEVRVKGELQEVVFFCNPSKSYHVLYGAKQVERPRYDIGTVLSQAQTALTAVYSLGPVKENTGYSASGRRMLVDGKKMMIVAVILMIATLGWLISKSMKKIDLVE